MLRGQGSHPALYSQRLWYHPGGTGRSRGHSGILSRGQRGRMQHVGWWSSCVSVSPPFISRTNRARSPRGPCRNRGWPRPAASPPSAAAGAHGSSAGCSRRPGPAAPAWSYNIPASTGWGLMRSRDHLPKPPPNSRSAVLQEDAHQLAHPVVPRRLHLVKAHGQVLLALGVEDHELRPAAGHAQPRHLQRGDIGVSPVQAPLCWDRGAARTAWPRHHSQGTRDSVVGTV